MSRNSKGVLQDPANFRYLRSLPVEQVREMARAESMPYVHERRKEEIVTWLMEYMEDRVDAARRAAQASQMANRGAVDEWGWCQGETVAQQFGASAASRSWGCERRPSRKEGDDPRYCWQHQPTRRS